MGVATDLAQGYMKSLSCTHSVRCHSNYVYLSMFHLLLQYLVYATLTVRSIKRGLSGSPFLSFLSTKKLLKDLVQDAEIFD